MSRKIYPTDLLCAKCQQPIGLLLLGSETIAIDRAEIGESGPVGLVKVHRCRIICRDRDGDSLRWRKPGLGM